ncbi:hypothetical protein [Catellatospora vulcania]|uniref:hypothetical protein n=1 Tax=Catellatospora vulcania TaxID=1460450 RepID=UPI0012D458CD|nr:hypothetical protein [Catellatospora vulcania]
MSDFEQDDVLWSAVDAYRADTDPLIRPTGSGAAYTAVRHRKRVRSVGVAASALAAALAGGVVFTTLGGPGPTVPTPGGTAGVSPTASPVRSASPLPVVTTGPRHGLAEATLDLPARTVGGQDCPTGPTRFRAGKVGTQTWIDSAVETDLDEDGTPEQVALIYCRPGEIPLGQVVAFRRSGDGFSTLGVVAQVEPPHTAATGTPDAVERITKLAADTSGEIQVEVGNHETTYSDLSGGPIGLYQWRDFRWNGAAFSRSGGAPSFVADPAVVRITVDVARPNVRDAEGGRRKVEVPVTIRVQDQLPADTPVTVLLSVGTVPGATVVRAPCEGAQQWVRCRRDETWPGTWQVIFELELPGAPDAPDVRNDLGPHSVYVRIGDQEFGRYSMRY